MCLRSAAAGRYGIVPMMAGAAPLIPLAGELGVRLLPVSRPEEIAALGDCL